MGDPTGHDFRIVATGVLLRLPREGDVPQTGGAALDPPATGALAIVAQAFVDFEADGRRDRWFGPVYAGGVPVDGDPTFALLAAARQEDPVDLLSDLRIAGHPATRWDYLRAPHTIELDAELEARLGPRRAG